VTTKVTTRIDHNKRACLRSRSMKYPGTT